MRPTKRCLLFFAAGFPVAVLPVLVDEGLWTVWLVWVGLAVLAAGIDAVLALPSRLLDVEVSVPSQLYVGEAGVAHVTCRSRGRLPPARLGVLCDLSADLLPREERSIDLPSGGERTLEVPLVAVRRGTVTVERVWMRWTGPLGLVSRHRVVPCEERIAVVPNIAAVRRSALRYARDRDVTAGARAVRLVGEGSEFDAMREYVPGLDHRAISWKASARHRKLVCQEFRAERNHQVIVTFDTGRLMAEPLEGVPKLDHAIHAGLLLAYTCLRTGDRVGLFAFDEKVRAYAAPRGGVQDFVRLQHMTAGLDYTTAETNFTLGLAELATRLTRRSLVVLLTDFVDTVTAELMVENAGRLTRRHLVVFVALRDAHLTETVTAPPSTLGALYRSVVANDFERERDLVLRRLERMGVFTIDAPPQAVGTDLLNRYLAIRRRELI